MRTAIIYEGPGGTRVENTSTTIVGTGDAGVTAVAEQVMAAGADRIELCGAVGAAAQAEVQAAVGPDVEVGAAKYGFESLEQIADFKQRFAAGEALTGAFLYLQPGADPPTDRVEHEGTTYVAVPDHDAVATVARELAADGVGLIELYAGLGPADAAEVLAATDGSVPVGVALFER